jgi:hypothetical protein
MASGSECAPFHSRISQPHVCQGNIDKEKEAISASAVGLAKQILDIHYSLMRIHLKAQRSGLDDHHE